MQPSTPLVGSSLLSGDMMVCTSLGVGDSCDRGRRRRWHDSSCPDLSSSELSPLEVDANLSSNYATFSHPGKHHQAELLTYWRWLLSLPWDSHVETIAWQKKRYRSSPLSGGTGAGGATNGQHPYTAQRDNSPFGCSWKVLYSTLLLVGLSAMYYRNFQVGEYGQYRHYDTMPEAQWDHNIYMPSNSATSAANTHFLIAQEALASLTEISSMPNRAYARQHGMDYARYAKGGPSSHYTQCFDKVILINMITDKQSGEDEDSPRGRLAPLFSLPARIEYDAVVLLPPDSIVTNLDCGIFDVLPRDKLVAIAGWEDDRSHIMSKTDIVFYNLRHKYANAVAKLWRDLVEPVEVSCGAGNDISLLMDAIASVLEDGERLSSVIVPLQESSKGYVRQRIKGDDRPQEDIFRGITPSTPGPRAQMLLNDLPNVRVELETRANAVCYRYWPRCEVL